MSGMKLTPKVILFNAAAVLVMGAAVVVQLRDLVNPAQSQVCSGRYNKVVNFGLERQGQLLTASDIQSTAVGRDFGVMDNYSARMLKDGPAKAALGVRIAAGTAQPNNPNLPAGGLSFPWIPRVIPANASAACLGYNIFLPADFEFDAGGTLPGISGRRADGVDRFDTYVEWGSNGEVNQFVLQTSTKGTEHLRTSALSAAALPRGRWVRIDQEVVMNQAGAFDGIMRLWVDGALRSEHKQTEYRTVAEVSIEGVAADVYFGTQPTYQNFPAARARKAEQIWLTPFELRWN